jgi:hypothetical protein
VIRIVNPGAGEYYGGLVAAPLTRRMLQDALAARRSALNRARFAEQAAPTRRRQAAAPGERPAPMVIELPWRSPDPQGAPRAQVPDVRGTTVRQAALLLHRRGFRVSVEGDGLVTGTTPSAGASARVGSRVRVRAGGSGAS